MTEALRNLYYKRLLFYGIGKRLKWFEYKIEAMEDSDKAKIDYILQMIQLYLYLLPRFKIGNTIMDFREKYTIR